MKAWFVVLRPSHDKKEESARRIRDSNLEVKLSQQVALIGQLRCHCCLLSLHLHFLLSPSSCGAAEHKNYFLLNDAAHMAAQTKDKPLGLDPELSTVTIIKESSSSQTEIYEHKNQGQWELDVLRDYSLQSNMATALRAFLDSFYHFCGYKPRWDNWVKQTEPKTGFNPRFKPRGKCVESSRQRLEEEFAVDENELVYLLGKNSCYNYNQDFVHELPVQVVAAAMSNISCKCTPARSRTYRLVWFMLTGYSTYHTAIDLEDWRYMGMEEVKQRRSVVDDQTEQLPFHQDLFNME